MVRWKYNKYKDDSPVKTVKKIRELLSEVDIYPIESQWLNSVKGFHSVSLSIPNSILSSNGKGTSYKYALASAYGEIIERLQNLATFRLGMNFNENTYKYMGFYYAPDERGYSKQALLNDDNEWLKIKLDKVKNVEKLLEDWKEVSYENIPYDFLSIPYINIKTKKLSYIPIKMVCKMYMSNGMCAGNSMEESMIQGICEIFERYVNKRIIKERLSPPLLSKEYLAKYPNLIAMINMIEMSGNFKVIVKDCSLGEGYPVIAVIFIDRDKHSYFVKFGSFPKFEIALERTLTELLQGQDILKMKGLHEFKYNKEIKDEHGNLLNIFVNGVGDYPTEFFDTSPSYDTSGFNQIDGEDSKELLKNVIKFIDDKGYQLFLRDVSFIGFPSYHVIIPGISEIEEFDDKDVLNKYSDYIEALRLIHKLKDLDDKDITRLVTILENERYNDLNSVANFLNLTLNSSTPWYFKNIGMLKLALYCKSGHYEKAHKVFEKYLSLLRLSNNNISMYFTAVNQFLAMKAKNKSNNDIKSLLSNFYAESIIQKIFEEFNQENIIDNNIVSFNCYDCNKCILHSYCNQIESESIYKKLKEKYLSSGINQKNLVHYDFGIDC